MDYSEHTDQQLTALLRYGDHLAYNEIYNRYKRKLYLFGFKRLGDKEEVRDLLQDIFTNLWLKHEAIIITETLNAYLHTAVKNKILDRIASKRISSKHVESLNAYELSITNNTDHLIRSKVMQELVDKEVSALPFKMREVFELSRKTNYSRKEIAKELGISEETVKSRMYMALKILKAKLKFMLVVILF
jgi:RNA polymerase sigma-70 factor (family 1)